jgi:hypothetical protein
LSKPSPNFSKSGQASPSLSQISPRKEALISLDFLGRNEPYQSVMLTPRAKNLFPLAFPLSASAAKLALRSAEDQGSMFSGYRKGKSGGA